MNTYIDKIPYIHLFKNSLGFYIYDINRMDILKIPKNIYNSLTLSNIEGHIEEDDTILQYVDMLKIKGYLKNNRVEVSENPVTEYYESLINHNLSNITLQITQQCNLNCHYCAYSGNYYTRQHANKWMSFETAKKAIDYVVQHSRDTNLLNIGFYGGEPLLAFETLKKCVHYAVERAEGKKPQFRFTTNGTLLTEEKFDFLVNHNFRIIISLDGPKHIHDKHRRYKDSNIGSFDTIINNVKLLKKKYPLFYRSNVSFNTVLDPLNNFNDINEFILNSEMLDSQYISSSVIDGNYIKEKIPYSEDFIAEFEYEIFKLYLVKLNWMNNDKISPLVLSYFSSIRRIANIIEGYFQEEVQKKFHRSGPCIPGVMKLFVSVDGGLFVCEKVSETSDAALIGHIDSGIDIIKAKEILNMEQATSNKCRNCWAYYFCYICVAIADDGETLSTDKIINSCEKVKRQVEANLSDYCVLRELGYNYEFDL